MVGQKDLEQNKIHVCYPLMNFYLQLAFNAVMMLWGHKILNLNGTNIAEKLLRILCHIFKGESTIREKLEKHQATKLTSTEPEASKATAVPSEATATSITTASRPRQEVIPVNPGYVQQVSQVSL